MLTSVFAFVFAATMIVQLPLLPKLGLSSILLLICLFGGSFFPRLRVLICFVLGLLYTTYIGNARMDAWLPVALQGSTYTVVGQIVSLPSVGLNSTRFQFQITSGARQMNGKTIAMSWFKHADGPTLNVGEKWRLKVRLTRPHGVQNPSQFDYEAWLLLEGVAAMGRVKKSHETHFISQVYPSYHYQRLRQKVKHHLVQLLPDDAASALLIALVIGVKEGIDRQLWQLLSATGTNHLMIISGLHVGLVAGIIFSTIQFLMARVAFNNRYLISVLSLILTLFYCLLAGMGLPVQRALTMVAISLAVMAGRRQIFLWQTLVIALLIVFLVNPLIGLSAGFWLSFSAVGWLLLVFSGVVERPQGWLAKFAGLLHSQWVIFITMLPLLALWVAQVSIIGFVVNLIAIPIITLTVVPLLLVATPLVILDLSVGNYLMQSAHILLEYFIVFLEFFAQLNWVFKTNSVNLMECIVALMGVIVLLAPKGFSPKWLAVIFFLPLISPKQIELGKGDFLMQVLDVGQGLSIIIRTQHQTLVYDTGPAFEGIFNAGEQILIPALNRLGTNNIHSLIISHSDLDHAGGTAALMRDKTVLQKFGGQWFDRCEAGQSWRVDGIYFEFLVSPRVLPVDQRSNNNKSCILLMTAGQYRVLFPGDIEAIEEEALLKRGLERVNILIAPHHGSLSSSTPGFLNRIRAESVIISAGYMNRFSHPNARIVARYRARDMSVFNTAQAGSVIVEFIGQKAVITTTRDRWRRFWF